MQKRQYVVWVAGVRWRVSCVRRFGDIIVYSIERAGHVYCVGVEIVHDEWFWEPGLPKELACKIQSLLRDDASRVVATGEIADENCEGDGEG